jgi:hypothetical protein
MRTLARLRANDKFSSDMVWHNIWHTCFFFLICGEIVEQIKVINFPYKPDTAKVEPEVEESQESESDPSFRF